MANLKTYLQKLFKMSGSQAMPDFSRKTSLVTHSNCNNLNYAVTANGYIQGRFKFTSETETKWACRLYANSQALVGSFNPGNIGTTYVDFLIPVEKGTLLTAHSEKANVNLDLIFIQLVGN